MDKNQKSIPILNDPLGCHTCTKNHFNYGDGSCPTEKDGSYTLNFINFNDATICKFKKRHLIYEEEYYKSIYKNKK